MKNIYQGSSFADKLAVARQFYPSKKELIFNSEFSDDPMGELKSGEKSKSFVHKYPEKILVLATNRCPVLCRFCTRKRITFQKESLAPDRFDEALKYIKSHPKINEVIFSGGDPFMLSDSELLRILKSFREIENLKKFRFHSRSLTMNPSRFNPDFFNIFNVLADKQISVVLHINHPAEINIDSEIIVNKLKQKGIRLFSQTVLLRRVNDNPDILTRLIKKTVKIGVQPYYLHQLDKVSGSAHFEVPVKIGLSIMETLKSNLPDCTIPRYMQDGPGGKREITANQN